MTEIPECLQHLPRSGGIPIPFFVAIPSDGSAPDFRLINHRNERQSLRFQLCSICGKYIAAPPYTFILGPLGIAQRLAFATPLHRTCALAALQICPFLARERFERSERPSRLEKREIQERAELPPKPARLALVEVGRYGVISAPQHAKMREPPLYATFGPELEACPMAWYGYRDGVLELEACP
jgi:hypothetical protein